jgi:hypothetical protein
MTESSGQDHLSTLMNVASAMVATAAERPPGDKQAAKAVGRFWHKADQLNRRDELCAAITTIAAAALRDICARTGEAPLNAIGRTNGFTVNNPDGKVIPQVTDNPDETLQDSQESTTAAESSWGADPGGGFTAWRPPPRPPPLGGVGPVWPPRV